MAREPVLESAVMATLWDTSTWMTPGDMQPRLPGDLALTTVGTVMSRLWRKGLLIRQKRGRAYEYRPAESREEYTAQRMSEILTAAREPSAALHRFIELLPHRDRRNLRRALEREDS